MSLRWRFILFLTLIHAIIFGLALWVLPDNKYLFLAIELLLVIVLMWSIHLYRTFLKPLNLIASGVETIRDRDFQSKFLPTGQAELDELIDVYNQMIDQLRDERTKQREQHYFLERLIHATPTGVLILDLDDKVSLMNPAAAILMGSSADELLGRVGDDLPGPLGASLKNMKAGETRVVSLSGAKTYRCHKSHFLDRGFHRHFLLIEELTHEILSSQKQAYTSVIRMMSHEVNNTVGAVNSILQTCLGYGEQLRPEDRIEFEQASKVAIHRNEGLNSFMSKLASVVRVPSPAKELCELGQLLKSVHMLLGAQLRDRNIEWREEEGQPAAKARLDVNQIEQVVINIVRNAIEAIDKDGIITIRTSANPTRLEVIDSGPGIDPALQQRLFSPFFSSKRDGRGIGLTLSSEILLNHDCSFNLEQHQDGGAIFWIEFVRDPAES